MRHAGISLTNYFNSPDDKVTDAAIDVFHSAVLERPWGVSLAAAFVHSPAFARKPSVLLHALDRHPGQLIPYAGVIETVTQRVETEFAVEARDFSARWAGEVRYVVSIVLRLYQEAQTNGQRIVAARALGFFDGLLRARVLWADRELRKMET